jgi:NAD(P)-dependent dehydrogenase (short-subunit alcohol dehydrogenase family)
MTNARDAESHQLTLITGGSRGIGQFLVRSFRNETDVLNVSRTPAEDPDRDGRHELYNLNLDLADVTLIEPCLSAWFDEHPYHGVKTLIHNAAVSNLGRLDEVSSEQVDEAFRVNVYAPLAITTALFRADRFARRGARVAYITSSLARPLPELSFAGLGLYSMTKAALSRMALIQSREFELAAPHIKVLRIHPGIVDTDLQRELRRDPRLDPAFSTKTAGLPP